MRRLLVLAFLLFVPDLFAQQGPPNDPAATRRADLVELVKLDPAIKLDIRYAGTKHLLGKPVYKEMEAEGFTVEPNEWWHYNYKDWREYPILDIPFSAIGK